MRILMALGFGGILLLTGSVGATDAMRLAQAPAVNCEDVMKKPMGQQTPAEFAKCSRPALQKAVCDAVENAARTNGCGRAGADDARCKQLSSVLMTCIRNGAAFSPQQQHEAVR